MVCEIVVGRKWRGLKEYFWEVACFDGGWKEWEEFRTKMVNELRKKGVYVRNSRWRFSFKWMVEISYIYDLVEKCKSDNIKVEYEEYGRRWN